jgi:hypothetical protein
MLDLNAEGIEPLIALTELPGVGAGERQPDAAATL